MNLIPKHVWVLAVLWFWGEQLLCGVEKDKPVRIDVKSLAGIGVPDEIRMGSDTACPPLMKVVSIEPQRHKIEHPLEPSAVERYFNRVVLRA